MKLRCGVLLPLTDAAGIFALVGAIIVSFVTAGSVYAKQRLDDAKKEEGS
jgi:hypothetical protein